MKLSNLSLTALVAVSALLGGGASASAQQTNAMANTNSPAMRAQAPARFGRPGERLKQELGLTEEQVPRVQAALQERMKNMQALRGLPSEERQEKARALSEKQAAAFKLILTPEQYQKWEKSRAQMPSGGVVAFRGRTNGVAAAKR
jgi:hypothetical protein